MSCPELTCLAVVRNAVRRFYSWNRPSAVPPVVQTLRLCGWLNTRVVCVVLLTLGLQVPTVEDREKQVKRYLLQAARVKQEQQNQELRMGTEKGLQALTKELFLASEVKLGQDDELTNRISFWKANCQSFHCDFQLAMSWTHLIMCIAST